VAVALDLALGGPLHDPGQLVADDAADRIRLADEAATPYIVAKVMMGTFFGPFFADAGTAPTPSTIVATSAILASFDVIMALLSNSREWLREGRARGVPRRTACARGR
jgi:hypothetical protein